MPADVRQCHVRDGRDLQHLLVRLRYLPTDLDCDYFATSLHKWLYGPHGTGLLYVRRDEFLVQERPYASAVSNNVTPRSTAACMSLIISCLSAGGP